MQIGANLMLSLSCLQGGVTLCWVPSLCAGAPWQLWDLRTELEQGRAGQERAQWDHKRVSLQLLTTVTGLKCSRLRWVDWSYLLIYWFINLKTCHQSLACKTLALTSLFQACIEHQQQYIFIITKTLQFKHIPMKKRNSSHHFFTLH